mgnify:CR=1 FL=1
MNITQWLESFRYYCVTNHPNSSTKTSRYSSHAFSCFSLAILSKISAKCKTSLIVFRRKACIQSSFSRRLQALFIGQVLKYHPLTVGRHSQLRRLNINNCLINSILYSMTKFSYCFSFGRREECLEANIYHWPLQTRVSHYKTLTSVRVGDLVLLFSTK